jgi:acetyl esterase/lipase
MGKTRRKRLRYGPRREQRALLRPAVASGPRPTVVFIHGGFWRWPYNPWLMSFLARDARRRGWCSLNVGYRRLGRFGGDGGWPETFDDVRSAIELVAEHPDLIDQNRVALVGHSAGGHLALWAAREVSIPLVGVISMAGVTDLEAAWNRGGDAVRQLLNRVPADRRFELTSPLDRLPLGVRIACVHGADDQTVLPEESTDYANAATAVGDDAVALIIPGEAHRDALRARSVMWATSTGVIDAWFGSSS